MKMKRFVFLFAIMFAFSATFVACGGGEEATDETSDEPTEDVAEEVAEETADFTKGMEVYAASCQVCHQAEGAGLEGAFPSLKGLTIDKQTILDNIKNGKTSEAYAAPMAAVELSDEDASAVADYVLSLK